MLAQDTGSADGLYTAARQEPFDNKDYDKAIRYALKALQLNPNYTDIIVFLDRLYS